MNWQILTQDKSSGKIHKRYQMPGGQLASYEGCNLDSAGAYDVIASVLDVRHPFTSCKTCFPGPIDGEDDGSTQPVETIP